MTRDEDLSVYRVNWSPEKLIPEINEGDVWGTITCIPADEMPPRLDYRKRLPIGFWTPLVKEVYLRLKNTPHREALRIPLASNELARRAYHAIRFGFRDRYGSDLIDLRREAHVLFVRRSEAWRTPSDRSSKK